MRSDDCTERTTLHCDRCGRTWFTRVASLIVDSPLARCAVCGGTLRGEPRAEPERDPGQRRRAPLAA